MPKKTKTSRKKWPPKGSKEPIAFMFQPDEYEVVEPERLSEWETLMREAVGFPRELVKSIIAARLLYTLSIRNGQFVD